jgi:hypothetical protein
MVPVSYSSAKKLRGQRFSPDVIVRLIFLPTQKGRGITNFRGAAILPHLAGEI